MSSAIRVLVVDDDFRVAGLHRDLVNDRPGFEVVDTAGSVGAARAALANHRPHLLLVDAYLPDGDGIEFVRSVDVDAFVLSAADDAPTIRRALHAGALGYFIKPFDRRALSDRLDRYARYRNLLGGDARLVQEDVDRASAILHGGAEAVSGSRSVTEQLVLAAIGDGEASAAEVGERAGISRATAQRHLAALAARDIVDVRLRYGTGRPEHRYARRRT
ncbi:response regulator [Microbacterium sp. NPDC057407]|uniref:response regulator n=1 Tax=Microbacterium sp. NPDC057407 TaxID=3346120 RepID=UPI00366F759E